MRVFFKVAIHEKFLMRDAKVAAVDPGRDQDERAVGGDRAVLGAHDAYMYRGGATEASGMMGTPHTVSGMITAQTNRIDRIDRSLSEDEVEALMRWNRPS